MAGRFLTSIASVLALCVAAFGQSLDPSSPTPILANEISSRIVPRDVGDSRLTTYYYTLDGKQGDLLINVESNNLDGDIDLFIADGLRPLTKFTLFSGGAVSALKTVFLRRAESLILRVQARSPNDNEGTYRLSFGGTFLPSSRKDETKTDAVAESSAPAKSVDKNVRRVTSVGGRIEEPADEAATTMEPSKPETPKEMPAPPAAAKTTTARKTATPSSTRRAGRRGTRARSATANKEPSNKTPAEAGAVGAESANNATVDAETAGKESSATTGRETTAKPSTLPPRARAGRTSRAAREKTANTSKKSARASSADSASATAANAPAESNRRLIIETKDGGKLVREMTEVRRVTVVDGLVVVVFKDGKVERQPLADVLRMSIEP